ncbi:MAG TPA: amidohydrolase [Dehalococcoidia bacterium]|nr:amidohydrolase [Dehalococcoidia bacterium]
MKGIIDVWVTPFTPDLLGEAVANSTEWKDGIAKWHMEERYQGKTADEFTTMMDEVGVERVLIVGAKAYSAIYHKMDIEWPISGIIDLVQSRPERFSGLYSINPYYRMDEVREMERVIREYGFKGAQVTAHGYERAIDDRDLYPFYAKCVELDVPIEIVVGSIIDRAPSEFGRPTRLENIAMYFPELRIIATHIGEPWVHEVISIAWKYPNVYIATTAHLPRYWSPSLLQFIDSSRGKGKVMYGSAYPTVPMKEALEQIESFGLKDDAKRLLLREVALKVFKLE